MEKSTLDFGGYMYDPTVGRWLSRDPIGFAAGDSNLYRYVGNSPTNETDPSGLQRGRNHLPYPLHLGGSALQPVIELPSERAHVAFHGFLRQRGFPYGDAGRRAWEALTERQQQMYIMRALRVAQVPNAVIRENICRIMANALPGTLTPRPSGFPGGIIRIPVAGAIAGVLMDTGTANAAEVRHSWRNQGTPTTVGHVEIREVTVVRDVPNPWNVFTQLLFGDWIVVSWNSTPWESYGEMTREEAQRLEGIDEVTTSSSTRRGYYRETTVSTEVRFTPITPNARQQ